MEIILNLLTDYEYRFGFKLLKVGERKCTMYFHKRGESIFSLVNLKFIMLPQLLQQK